MQKMAIFGWGIRIKSILSCGMSNQTSAALRKVPTSKGLLLYSHLLPRTQDKKTNRSLDDMNSKPLQLTSSE